MVTNDNFICSGEGWQFHITSEILWLKWQCHLSTDIYWPRMAIAHVYRHLVVMNDNFILLQICSSNEWPFHIVCHISWSRMVTFVMTYIGKHAIF